jgi:hypothetical protein
MLPGPFGNDAMTGTEETAFLRAFENGTLDPEEFDHEGHVYAAWCCLRHYGDPVGKDRFVRALKRFVKRHGAVDKYHETMTRAFLDLISSRREMGSDWKTFRRANQGLVEQGLGHLLLHYSEDRLFSGRARREFLPPDRIPLPTTRRTAKRSARDTARTTTRSARQDLRDIPGIGPRMKDALLDLGYERVGDLRGADPEKMYADLCRQRNAAVDRCVLYVFRCAVYFASQTVHDPELLKWWRWKDKPAREASE